MKLAVAASSQTPIGIGSAGIHDMVLYPSRVQRRVGHKGCFSTCGRSARPYGAEAAEPAFHRGLALPSKNPPLNAMRSYVTENKTSLVSGQKSNRINWLPESPKSFSESDA